MGCNTSKEVQTAEENNKADIKENGENGGEEARVEENNTEDKSASAKTVTLKSASRPNSTAPSEKAETVTEPEATTVTKPEDESCLGEEEAATKIQAVFRGHKTRKSMKQSDKPTTPATEAEPTREELEAEFRADDQELCHAATKIQASFRGHMARKNKEKDEEAGETVNAQKPQEEEEVDIDLTDPELSKAAVKIQASFRGHMSRKENETAK